MARITVPLLRQCGRCKLHEGREVYPEAPALGKADILVVGEAPGIHEKREGVPFMGSTGKVLRRMLARAGLHSRCVFINVVQCRPPKNRDPEPDELEACAPWLALYMQHFKPRAVICVGRFSARWGGFKGGIGRHHGKVVRRGDRLWLAVYHPSYLERLRRNYAQRERYRAVEASTRQAYTELQERLDTDAAVPDYHPHVVQSIVPAAEEPYFVDIEGYGPGDPDGRTHNIAIMSLRQNGRNYVFPQPARAELAEWRGRPGGHNFAMYDLPILLRAGMPRPDAVDDTMVLAHMQCERQLALKDLARTHFGVITESYEEVSAAGGWDRWANYSAQDVELDDRLLQLELSRMGSEGYLYYNVESRLVPILAEASLRGFHVDSARAIALNGAMLSKLRTIEMALLQWFPFPERVGKEKLIRTGGFKMGPEQVASAISTVLGVRLKDTTESTLLKLYAKTKHPLVGLILARRKASYAISHYTRKLLDTEVVSTILNTIGTETGRMSSRDPNLQNWPAYTRKVLRAPLGMKMISGDYSQIEMRIAAYLSHDKAMIAAFRDERDLHGELSQAVYGYVTPDSRTRTKSANFEKLFGGGAYKLAEIVNIPLAEAKKIDAGHKRLYPEYNAWMPRQVANVKRTGETRTIMGRRRAIWDLESDEPKLRDKATREAINTPIQGSNGDFTKYAMVLADPPMRQLGGYVQHQVHDSIDCFVPEEVPDADGKEALTHAMMEAVPKEFKDVIPVKVKVTVSTHWQ